MGDERYRVLKVGPEKLTEWATGPLTKEQAETTCYNLNDEYIYADFYFQVEPETRDITTVS